MEADEALALSIFLGIPLLCLVYAIVRSKMAGGKVTDSSGWRDITLIDVAVVIVIAAIFLG